MLAYHTFDKQTDGDVTDKYTNIFEWNLICDGSIRVSTVVPSDLKNLGT